MRLVFVSFYPAYPPVTGAAAVTWNCARFAGGDRALVQLGNTAAEEMREGVRVITVPGATEQRWRRVAQLPRKLRALAAACRQLAPESVVLEGASWALYHALLLRRLRRQLPAVRVVYHAHNVEYLLRQGKHGRVVRWLTRWAEGHVLRHADHAFAVSDCDAMEFERLYGVRPALLPNGVDVARFEAVTPAEILAAREKYGLTGQPVLFMGLYSYRPNREAVDFLVRAFPDIVADCPQARLAVLGERLPFARPWLLNTGSVPYAELPAVVRACAVGTAPIFSGSGTRLKILEYLAAGLPVVSTAKGAEGLALRSEEHLLVCRPEQFAAATVRLLRDAALAARLGAAGHREVAVRYAWPVIMSAFDRGIATGGVVRE